LSLPENLTIHLTDKTKNQLESGSFQSPGNGCGLPVQAAIQRDDFQKRPMILNRLLLHASIAGVGIISLCRQFDLRKDQAESIALCPKSVGMIVFRQAHPSREVEGR
jgi:hypothetical protein